MNIHVFIFRRDLRLVDNIAYHEMIKNAKTTDGYVLPIFIFNSKQINPKKNAYFSPSAAQFMLESLDDLDKQLGTNVLCAYSCENECNVVESIIDQLQNGEHVIYGVYFNRDYTPFARKRDDAICDFCTKQNIPTFVNWSDYSLVDIPSMPKPYKVFSAFLKKYKHSNVSHLVRR